MKLILQISFLLLAWFANLADATSVCVKVDVSSYKVSLTTLGINSDGVVDNLGRFALAAGKQFSKEALFIITKASTITNDVVDGAWKFYTTITKNRVFAEINTNGDLIIKEFSNANFTGSSDDIVRSAHYTNPSGQIETGDIAFVTNTNGVSGVTKKIISGAGNAIPNLLNKVDSVENAIVAVAKNEAEILNELVKTNNTVTENAKKFWAQHEMNLTSYLETTYGSTKVGQQITVDVYIQGITTPVRCRIDNLIDVSGNGTLFRIADGKSSIVNNLSTKTPTELLNSMSTANQKTFYDALKNGTITQIKPAGQRAQNFLGNLNPIQVEKSVDFFVNDISTNGYNIFKKTLVQ